MFDEFTNVFLSVSGEWISTWPTLIALLVRKLFYNTSKHGSDLKLKSRFIEHIFDTA